MNKGKCVDAEGDTDKCDDLVSNYKLKSGILDIPVLGSNCKVV